MATQQQIADHLDISQQRVSALMVQLDMDWKSSSMDDIRLAYLRHLRERAAEYESKDGDSLTEERVLTERVDRELKQLALADKKLKLINVSQLELMFGHMVAAFRAELLVRDDKLAADLGNLYGIQVDVAILNKFTYAALAQLYRFTDTIALK